MKDDELHIGYLIKKKLEDEGRLVNWLAKVIHCKRRNIYDIFNRTSIDTIQLLRISLALRSNFFVHFSEICDNVVSSTDNTAYKSFYTVPQDDIPIGIIIKNKLVENGQSVKWLAEKLHCKRNNIYNILNRNSVDTALLLRISKALGTNFFEYFCNRYNNMVFVDFIEKHGEM